MSSPRHCHRVGRYSEWGSAISQTLCDGVGRLVPRCSLMQVYGFIHETWLERYCNYQLEASSWSTFRWDDSLKTNHVVKPLKKSKMCSSRTSKKNTSLIERDCSPWDRENGVTLLEREREGVGCSLWSSSMDWVELIYCAPQQTELSMTLLDGPSCIISWSSLTNRVV